MDRIRRGKLVKIPPEWVGKITTEKTKRERKRKARLKVLERRRRLKRYAYLLTVIDTGDYDA